MSDETRPTIHGFDQGPLRNWFLSQIAIPPTEDESDEEES